MQRKLAEAKQKNLELTNEMKRIENGKTLLDNISKLEVSMRDKNNQLTMELEHKKAEYLKLKEQVDEQAYFQELQEAFKKGGLEQVQK